MSLADSFEAILRRFEGKDVCRRDRSLPVWDVGRLGLFSRERREAMLVFREELLSALFSAGVPVFICHESPDQHEVPGCWQRADRWSWTVPLGFDVHDPAAKYWLFVMGNWCIYSAAGPVNEPTPDAFRCSPAELLSWMKAKSVEVLIDSFHDGTDWVVALKYETSARGA